MFGWEPGVKVIVAIKLLKQYVSISMRLGSVIQARCGHASLGNHEAAREANGESRRIETSTAPGRRRVIKAAHDHLSRERHLRIRMISAIWRPTRKDQELSANLALPERRRWRALDWYRLPQTSARHEL